MTRDIKFVYENPKDAEAEPEFQMDLGSGDAWSCYMRVYLIAAYIMLKKKIGNSDSLTAILKICPPDYTTISCEKFRGYELIQRSVLCDIWDDLVALNLTGLALLLNAKYNRFVSYEKILLANESLQTIKPFIPLNPEDLKNTPYESVNFNTMDERILDLCELFENVCKTGKRVSMLME